MITVHFFAAARAAAGQSNQSIIPAEISSDQPTVGEIVAYLGNTHSGRTPSGMSLGQVLEQCSFLVNGARADLDVKVPDGVRLDVLPPFAGG
ncbi:MoaD/ThiS family protein [Rothia amarae]|uniref:MoaD/ThiS family protein n=1 Tax=Rothia amarae TaxID=169480 RepID=A0A7H2BL53_9MICC|nr:MoaD/ThiS family protein [Rothia amarae]QNV40399.1 MoaD/ThiS family protein [Rothia amarae]